MPSPTIRSVLLSCAGVISVGIIVDKAITRVPTFLSVVRGDPLPPLTSDIASAMVTRYNVWIALALVALGCVLAADGRHAVGLDAPARRCGVVFGAYLVPMVPFFLSVSAFTIVLAQALGISDWIGNHGLDVQATNLWDWLYTALMAGIVEEIVAVAVAYRLLELIPIRSGARNFADTGWATAVLIGLRLSYHSYYGLGMLCVAVMAWLVIRLYRVNRALLPLIVAHFCYDAMSWFAPGRVPLLLTGLTVLIVCSPRSTPLKLLVSPFGFTARRSSQVQSVHAEPTSPLL